MKIRTKFVAALALFAWAGSASAYDFVVSNATKSKITRIQVSEDGKTWGNFDIGKGIAAGASATLVWSEATNNSGCEWQVKAAYADGSESEPAKFDFCEEDLEIEFTE